MQVRNYIEMSMTLPLAWFPTRNPLEALTITPIYWYNLRKNCAPYFVHTESEKHQDVHTYAADHAHNIVISHTLMSRKLQINSSLAPLRHMDFLLTCHKMENENSCHVKEAVHHQILWEFLFPGSPTSYKLNLNLMSQPILFPVGKQNHFPSFFHPSCLFC